MKIIILESNITDPTTFNAGMALVHQVLDPLAFISWKYQITNFPFTSIPFSTTTISGYQVDPTEILKQTDGTEDTAFLIFNASTINPQPLNPTCSSQRQGNALACQMCEHWYQKDPHTFAEFFTHELCHRIFDAIGATDITHLLTDGDLQKANPVLYSQFNTKQPIEYYTYLIKSLIPAWYQYQAGQNKNMENITIDSQGPQVISLQENLIKIGYTIAADGEFGRDTYKALVDFQTKHGLDADGIAGPITQEILQEASESALQAPITPQENTYTSIEGIITSVCIANGIEPEVLIAVATCESGLNPNAKLFNPGSNSTDRGLLQWNSKYHSEISDDDAYNPTKSIEWGCKYLKENPKNLHGFWSASEHCWSTQLSAEIKSKYGIV